MYVLGCPWVLVPNGTSSWAQLKWKANVLAFQSCSVFQGPRASSPETRIRTHLPFLQGPAPMPLLASSLGSLLLYPSLHTHPVLQEFCSARPVKSLHLLYTVPGSEVGVTGRSPATGRDQSSAQPCTVLSGAVGRDLSPSFSLRLCLSVSLSWPGNVHRQILQISPLGKPAIRGKPARFQLYYFSDQQILFVA